MWGLCLDKEKGRPWGRPRSVVSVRMRSGAGVPPGEGRERPPAVGCLAVHAASNRRTSPGNTQIGFEPPPGPSADRPGDLAGAGGEELGVGELAGDRPDCDAVVQADADHEVIAPGGEVVGHRELLGRGARDAQLGGAVRPRNGRLSFREHGRISAGRRVHDHHDPPLGSGRSDLRYAHEDEREKPGDEERTGSHTNERNTYDEDCK
jgi:hypothetical protein